MSLPTPLPTPAPGEMDGARRVPRYAGVVADAPQNLGFTLTGFHDEALEERPIGSPFEADDDPRIGHEHRALAAAAVRRGWTAGVFHAGDGYMDYLVWRPIHAPHQVPAAIADLIDDSVAAPHLWQLGIDVETFLIVRGDLVHGWRSDDIYGIHVVVGDDIFDRMLAAWPPQRGVMHGGGSAALVHDLQLMAALLRARELDDVAPGGAPSLADIMFEL